MATTIFLVNPFVSAVTPPTYLLDTYSAAAGYSLRQLKTGVTSVVRVRRSSDNAESDFTATDITDGTLVAWTGANDGFVVTWYDQAGSNNITQSTAASQPKLVSSGTVLTKGSLPAVEFDGSNDYLDKSPAFINSTDISSFSVSHSSSTGNVGTVLALAVDQTSTLRVFQDSRTTPNRNLVVNTPTLYAADLSTARVDTNQRLLSSFIDSSKNMSAFDNGATGGTSTYVGTFINNGLMVGRQQTTSYLNGGVQEIILFNTDESANRAAIESDIETHYWGADLLLDTYTGAAAAYSLRKLSKLTTNVVRVRRSSDNSEQDFTADEITDGSLSSWVDAGGGTQQGFVTTWYDQVGSADLTQTTATLQPEIYDNSTGLRTFGNGNCLSFPVASSNYMNIGSSISELNDAPFSIFAAAQNNQSTQGAVICENLNNGGTGKLQLRLDTDGLSGIMLRYKNSSGTNYDIGASANLTSNTEYLISAFSDASKNISEFDNGNTGGTGTFTGSYTGNDFYIGKLGDSSVYLKGQIAELIVFGTDESANRTAIETDINTHYSIY